MLCLQSRRRRLPLTQTLWLLVSSCQFYAKTVSIRPSVTFLVLIFPSVWMLHAEGNEYQQLLERLRSLPSTAETKVSK